MGAAIFGVALAVGFAVARPLAPSRLHAEVEQILAELLDGDVEIGSLRMSLGWGIRLEGDDVTAYPRDGGPALRADRAIAEIRPLAHLTGQQRVRSITLERPVLRVTRAADGRYAPPPMEKLLGDDEGDEAGAQQELLQPLIMVETTLRRILEGAVVADRFEIVDARITFADSAGPTPRAAALFDVDGTLTHSRFFDETLLVLRGRIADMRGDRGGFEWEGRRERGGGLRIAFATTELDLTSITPWLLGARPDATLEARVSGVGVLDSPEPGHGELEVDLVARSVLSGPEPVSRGPLEAERVALEGTASISPGAVALQNLRFSSDELELELDGTLERPLIATARADLALAVRDVTVRDLRHLISWLPEVRRDEAQRLLQSVERGRLRLLRAAGQSRLDRWQSLLAGRTGNLPHNFVVDAYLENTTVDAGADDKLEGLSGRLWWTGERVEVQGATARLNGTPLPRLDLKVEGVHHLFASDASARTVMDGAEPLAGLQTLWRTTHTEGEAGSPLDLRLHLDHLEHPMFFWPLAQAEAHVQTIEDGVEIAIERARWAGVPIRGTATWVFEPSERVEAQFSAFPTPASGAPRPRGDTWAKGSFEVGPIESKSWRQDRASGVFAARGDRIDVRELEIALAPRGTLEASGRLDLSERDAVPLSVDFVIEAADLSQLTSNVGLPPELTTGTLNAWGKLDATLRDEESIARSLNGTLSIDARNGTIRQAIPAVAAVALASAAVNPFASREAARFDRLAAEFALADGQLDTPSLTLDGPDVRAFASGGIGIGAEPHALDVDVVLYLFRPVDFVLDKIPLVNVLLLGPNNNLIAAHFNLSGPWDAPKATVVPHKSLTSGPGHMVFEGVPALVRRGFRAIGSLMGGAPAEGAPEGSDEAAPADS